jgi:hypothetical protein
MEITIIKDVLLFGLVLISMYAFYPFSKEVIQEFKYTRNYFNLMVVFFAVLTIGSIIAFEIIRILFPEYMLFFAGNTMAVLVSFFFLMVVFWSARKSLYLLPSLIGIGLILMFQIYYSIFIVMIDCLIMGGYSLIMAYRSYRFTQRKYFFFSLWTFIVVLGVFIPTESIIFNLIHIGIALIVSKGLRGGFGLFLLSDVEKEKMRKAEQMWIAKRIAPDRR